MEWTNSDGYRVSDDSSLKFGFRRFTEADRDRWMVRE
jgi:hypothetical protein